MNKKIFFIILIASTGVFLAAKIIIFADTMKTNRDFLKSYGWEISTVLSEREEITIPDPFDRVYESYNRLQTEAGLDLNQYRGKKCIRYTYIVKNYPKDVGEEVRANIICCDGIPIGGDIMTVGLSGFIHSLNYPVQSSVTCYLGLQCGVSF